MARIRLGPVVTAISGKIGAVQFVTAARGALARSRPGRRPTASPAILVARSAAALASSAWSSLTAAQRAEWATLAATLRWPSAFGPPKSPTARQLFLSHNVRLIRCGLAVDTAAPVPIDNNVVLFNTVSVNVPDLVSIDVTPGQPLFGPYAGLEIDAAPIFGPSNATFDGFDKLLTPPPHNFRFLAYHQWTSAGSVDFYPSWLSAFGPLQSGQVIILRCTYVKNGFLAGPTRFAGAYAP